MEQQSIADADDVKLRLGISNPSGQQKVVNSLIVTDLVELARNHAISDADVLSGCAVRDGVFEMKIQYGPGYRLYFIRRGSELIVLLCGGDKGSQRRDIERAKRLAVNLEE